MKSVITSQISIYLILERKSGSRAHELIRQLGFSTVQEITLIEDVSLEGLVGHGIIWRKLVDVILFFHTKL